MMRSDDAESLWSVPEDWHWTRLGEVAEVQIGKTPSRAEAGYWSDGSFPWVSISDLNDGLVVSTRELVSDRALQEVLANKISPAGTLLMSFKLTIGKMGILGMRASHNEAIASIYPNERIVLRDYLFYLFQTFPFDRYKDPYVKGPTLNKAKLLRLPIPIPPLDVQESFVSVLDAIRGNRDAQSRLAAGLDVCLRSFGYALVRGASLGMVRE